MRGRLEALGYGWKPHLPDTRDRVDTTPPSGVIGTPYNYRFVVNGRPAPVYRLASGQLPPGLMLDTDGTLHGTPTDAGTYSFSVAASNVAGVLPTSALNVVIALST